jgi:hypothetical protein
VNLHIQKGICADKRRTVSANNRVSWRTIKALRSRRRNRSSDLIRYAQPNHTQRHPRTGSLQHLRVHLSPPGAEAPSMPRYKSGRGGLNFCVH